jgi:hypothetical protein
MKSESLFENRIIFLLCVIVTLLLAALWGAYHAFMKIEDRVDNVMEKTQTFYEQNQSKIPEIIEDVQKFLKKEESKNEGFKKEVKI